MYAIRSYYGSTVLARFQNTGRVAGSGAGEIEGRIDELTVFENLEMQVRPRGSTGGTHFGDQLPWADHVVV